MRYDRWGPKILVTAMWLPMFAVFVSEFVTDIQSHNVDSSTHLALSITSGGASLLSGLLVYRGIRFGTLRLGRQLLVVSTFARTHKVPRCDVEQFYSARIRTSIGMKTMLHIGLEDGRVIRFDGLSSSGPEGSSGVLAVEAIAARFQSALMTPKS